MLRLALLRSLRTRPTLSCPRVRSLPCSAARTFTCSTIRAFAASARRPAQAVRVQKGDRDEVVELESAPVVLAVAKRMRAREALQAQVSENMNTPEDKERMKRLAESEPLRVAWEEWTHTSELLRETLQLLSDPDPDMRALAVHERGELLEKLAGMAAETFPALLVPPSRTAGMGAMVELKAGVGGAEAMLFAEDLTRMYARLSGAAAGEGKRWTTAVVGSSEAEGGGVKEALVEVRGRGAYDVLRWESGVHRVQRVPATESSGRVHTSTVAVLVLPLEEEGAAPREEDALYKMEDVRVEVMRSRGAGGQHVNKTESAVRLTHVPTGITVSMQDERSQHQNRRRAFQVLQARLMDRKLTQDALEKRSMRRSLVKSADRSEKIRTYNYAQDRVTDHRLGLSLMNLTSVMEGDGLGEFLDAMAKKYQEELLIEACENED